MTLQDWGFVQRGSLYTAPECRSWCINGVVYGSDKFSDGTRITTSRIDHVSENNGEFFVHTVSGSVYTLGSVSQEFIAVMRPGMTVEGYLRRFE